MPSHRLIHPELKKRLAATPIAPAWPSYTGTSQFLGTTPDGRCTVYYDPSLGEPCHLNAMQLLSDAQRIMAANDALFGVAGGPVSVIVFALGGATDGTGGADHMGCDFNTGQNIEVCASFGQGQRVSALFEAELSECSMNGVLCGSSTGEALSRWCSMVVSNNALSDFATAPTWFADGMPNFVDTVDPTDQNADSTGCGMAFISWLMNLTVGAITLSRIAQGMVTLGDAGTFADLYAKLTGLAKDAAWGHFSAAITALPNGVTSDDPFGAMGTPQPQPEPNPPPPLSPPPTSGPGTSTQMLASLLLMAIASDLNGDEPSMKADVQSILDAN